MTMRLAIVLVLAAFSAAATPESPVEIRTSQFRPGHIDVKAGTTVRWTNQDDIIHTVTSGMPEARDGRFAQRLEGKGTATTIEFKEPGLYPYFCERHTSMRGEIRVN
jgi:plastocyanin